MGLAQYIKAENDELSFDKKWESGLISIKLNQEGKFIYIHHSGGYFHELGLLLESLGNISTSVTLEDI